MSKPFRAVKGTRDLLPKDTVQWRRLEAVIHDTMRAWSYGEIRTPVFESTELFARSVGEESDIVSKQMYTLSDQSDNSLTLRPELTAPTMRAYIQHDMARDGALTKLYYMDTLFRQERPQAGRMRQFSQFGAEAIGSPHPEQDAEVISLICAILDQLGVDNLEVVINSIGSAESRKRYRSELVSFLTPLKGQVSETSQRRLETNPLRILDTSDEKEQALLADAPDILEFLNEDDLGHFEELQKSLTQLGVDYRRDKSLVRGLDYYTRTTFEITSPDVGAQSALCGGGRYDDLIAQLGGKPTPAVGFAAGIERILMAAAEQKESSSGGVSVYVVTASDGARAAAAKLADDLRRTGITASFDTLRRSVKAQLREANRLSSSHAVFLGDDELASGSAEVKELDSGRQSMVAIEGIIPHFTTG